ncbi:MAG: T9SS type A sorting domain-containing protein [Paludibacter sp.]
MKKITLLLSFIVCVMFAQAQTNLMVNGGFETWDGTTLSEWTLTTATGQSFSKETTIVKSGNASLKSAHTGTGGTAKIVIKTKIAVNAGDTYTFSYWYYVDPVTTNLTTAFRNWGYWNNPDGSQGTFDQSNLQMGDGQAYITFDGTGEWIKRSIDVTAPTGSGTVQLELRFYKGATIYVDDITFSKVITGTSNPTEDAFHAIVSGKNLLVKNVANGSTVEIYSAIGSKVQSSVLENGAVKLNNLSKGMYIVRIGKLTQKFML